MNSLDLRFLFHPIAIHLCLFCTGHGHPGHCLNAESFQDSHAVLASCFSPKDLGSFNGWESKKADFEFLYPNEKGYRLNNRQIIRRLVWKIIASQIFAHVSTDQTYGTEQPYSSPNDHLRWSHPNKDCRWPDQSRGATRMDIRDAGNAALNALTAELSIHISDTVSTHDQNIIESCRYFHVWSSLFMADNFLTASKNPAPEYRHAIMQALLLDPGIWQFLIAPHDHDFRSTGILF